MQRRAAKAAPTPLMPSRTTPSLLKRSSSSSSSSFLFRPLCQSSPGSWGYATRVENDEDVSCMIKFKLTLNFMLLMDLCLVAQVLVVVSPVLVGVVP